jgi:glycine cleavage system H protein
MKVPDGLQYTKDHEWVRHEGDLVVVGITDFAQSELGDIVFVELPQKGATLTAGKEFGTVESVKAVSEIFAPVSGEVVAVNETLGDAPETVNNDPYDAGWILKIRPSRADELAGLLTPAAYAKLIEGGGH